MASVPADDACITAEPEARTPPIQLDPLAFGMGRQRLLAKMFGTVSATPRLQQYALLGELGRGGMGVVYEAYDRELDRKVAIKLLHARHDSPESKRRFKREAQALARLSHPNVVPLFEVAEHEGAPFLVMEFVVGRTLREWADERDADGELEHGLEERVAMLLETGRGLAAAHAAGLVHRDFKPDNVMVGVEGRPRILDFGLARGTDQLRSGVERPLDLRASTSSVEELLAHSMTAQGTLMGTPAYMAPEQLRAGLAEPASDQFAFCVAAFELLHGERPFSGSSVKALALAVHTAAPQLPERSLFELPTPLHEAIIRGLDVEPEARWPDMDALLDAFAAALASFDQTPRRMRRRWIIAALGLSALAAGVTAASIPAADDTPMCEFDGSALAGTWDAARSEALRARLLATDFDFAEQSHQLVADALDAWADAWVEGQRSACEATRVTGGQSEAALDARMACLDRKRRELATTVDVLLEATDEALADSSALLARLPDVEACSNPASLATPYPLPSEPDARAQIRALEAKLDRARAARTLGDLAQVRAITEELSAALDGLEYPPLALEIQMLVARAPLDTPDYDAAAEAMLTVTHEASALGLDELAASFRVQLARTHAGEWSKPDKERWLVNEADAALRRVSRPNDPRAHELLKARAALLRQEGRHAEALAIYEGLLDADGSPELRNKIAIQLDSLGQYEHAREMYLKALELARERYGEQAPAVARLEADLGMLLLDHGDLEGASSRLERALAMSEEIYGTSGELPLHIRFAITKLLRNRGDLEAALTTTDLIIEAFQARYGPDHELTAEAVTARGTLRFFNSDFRKALSDYERALAVQARVLGPHHPDIGVLHSNIGECRVALDEHESALEAFDRALRILDLPRLEHEAPHPRLALPYKGRGQALLALGRVPEAIESLEHALDINEHGSSEDFELADTRLSLAEALVRAGRDIERARQLATEARVTFLTLEALEHVERIDLLMKSSDPIKSPRRPPPLERR